MWALGCTGGQPHDAICGKRTSLTGCTGLRQPMPHLPSGYHVNCTQPRTYMQPDDDDPHTLLTVTCRHRGGHGEPLGEHIGSEDTTGTTSAGLGPGSSSPVPTSAAMSDLR